MRIGDFGQPHVEKLLDDMLARGRVGGSYLFEGAAGVGKEAVAVELGRLLNCENDPPCPTKAPFTRAPEAGNESGRKAPGRGAAAKATRKRAPVARDTTSDAAAAGDGRCGSCRKFDRLQHPDLLLVFPVPRDVWDEALHEKRGEDRAQNTVGRILQAKSQNPYFRPQDFDRPSSIQAEILREHVLPMVASRPVEARFKTLVLADADQVTRDMGNILLKTLEEPPADCLLVLTTSVPQRLLPTIRSRCQSLRFAPLDPEWMQPHLQTLLDVPPVKAKLAAAVSQGSMLTAQRFVEGDLEEVRDHAFGVFEAAAKGEELDLLEIAQLLHHEHPKRRHLVPLMLQMLAVIARDALLVTPGVEAQRGGADLPRLANTDRLAEVERIAHVYPAEALPRIIQRVERAEGQIAGNALVEHALAALFLDIAALPAPMEKAGGRR